MIGRPKGSKNKSKNEAKYWLPEGITLKEGQTVYTKRDKLIFIDSEFGEFVNSYTEIQRAGMSTHPQATKRRIKATNLAKFGVENPNSNPEVRAKAKKTMMERYGVENPTQNPEFLAKAQETTKKNYGVTNPMHSQEIKEKQQGLLLYDRGVDNPGKIRSERSLILPNDELLSTYCKKLNFESAISRAKQIYHRFGPQICYEWINSYKEKKSFLEIYFEKNFNDIPHINCRQKKVHPEMNFRPDFKITETLYVDVDGLLYHSELYKKGRDDYHLKKAEEYRKHGLTLLQFTQDELFEKKEIIRSIIKNKANLTTNKYFARELEIRSVSQTLTSSFLKTNHFMGAALGTKNIGLFDKDELVCLMTYRKKEDGIEIARFCNKIDTVVVGGFSRLVSYIEKNHRMRFLESFVDLKTGTGQSLLSLDFHLEKVELGWKWTDGERTYNRLQCRANMDERRLSQEEYAKELHWFKIYDAGQARYRKYYY